MAARNDQLDDATAILTAAGVTYTITIGKHYRVAWIAAGRTRLIFCARTGSDWRGEANNRARIKRMLREDGLLA